MGVLVFQIPVNSTVCSTDTCSGQHQNKHKKLHITRPLCNAAINGFPWNSAILWHKKSQIILFRKLFVSMHRYFPAGKPLPKPNMIQFSAAYIRNKGRMIWNNVWHVDVNSHQFITLATISWRHYIIIEGAQWRIKTDKYMCIFALHRPFITHCVVL